MKYVAYIRVSTAGQKDGTSPENQIEECKKVAGDNALVIFEDASKGWRALEKRKVLMEAIDALEEKDAFVVHCPDRLARNSDTIGAIKYLIRKKGARLVYANGSPTDSDSLQDIIMSSVENMVAMIEKATLGRRMKAAHKTKRQNGEWLGFLPYGWKKDGDMMVTCPEEAKTLRWMRKYREQGLSYRKIADELNLRKRFNRSGGFWTHHSVWRILSSDGNIPLRVARQEANNPLPLEY